MLPAVCVLPAARAPRALPTNPRTRRYPGLFSGGLVSHEGPTREQMAAARCCFRFTAAGYSQSPAAGATAGPPDQQVCTAAGLCLLRCMQPQPVRLLRCAAADASGHTNAGHCGGGVR
jgi:hypothetical protein